MADAQAAAASKVRDDLAPWWAWGYVLAIPFALLTLVTPWFRGVLPRLSDVYDSGQHVDYTAWTSIPLGIVCPVWLVVLSGQWYRARRLWRWPPGPSDWRGLSRRSGRTRSAAELARPDATGAWYSLVVAAVSLAVLGLNRANFRPTYQTFDLTFTDFSAFSQGKAIVHPAIGCWFFLIAVGLFVVTSVVGLLVTNQASGRAKWEPEVRSEPL
jgi:hypothetical protein